MKIKYFSKDYPRLKKITEGDWIDLRVDRIVDSDDDFIEYKKGDVFKVGLGVAIDLPKGYEAIVAPRSSTFSTWKVLQTNSIGVIDNSYCGDSDEWLMEYIAMADGRIQRFDRVCQFRIQENQVVISLEEVESLNNESRGGYGTTGRR